MIYFDTDVLVKFYVEQQDQQKHALAQQRIEQATSNGLFFYFYPLAQRTRLCVGKMPPETKSLVKLPTCTLPSQLVLRWIISNVPARLPIKSAFTTAVTVCIRPLPKDTATSYIPSTAPIFSLFSIIPD